MLHTPTDFALFLNRPARGENAKQAFTDFTSGVYYPGTPQDDGRSLGRRLGDVQADAERH